MKEILIVEDNRINQIVASRILAGLGMKVNIVSNGFEALATIKSRKYDLIFMDCQMPEMDGYTAVGEIRKLEKQNKIQKVPVIALTAHTLADDSSKCIKAGMDDYLSKPVTEQAFADMLKKWLGEAAIGLELGSANQNSYKYLSISDLDKLFNIMGVGFFGLMDMYFSSIHDLMSDLEIAIVEENYVDTLRAAHTIKSPSRQVGSIEVAAKADEIEELVREQAGFNDISVKFVVLREQVMQANIELKQYIDSKNKVA